MLDYQNKKENLSALVEKFERKDLNTSRLKNTIFVGITYCLTYQIVQTLQIMIFQTKNEQNQLVPWILPAEGVPLAFLLYFGLSILPFVYVSFLSNEIILKTPLTLLFVFPIIKVSFYGLNVFVLRKYLNLKDSFQALENACHFFIISFIITLLIPISQVLVLIMTKSVNNISLQWILNYIIEWFLPVICGIFSFTPLLQLVVFPFIEILIKKDYKKNSYLKIIEIILYKSTLYIIALSVFILSAVFSTGASFSLFMIF